MSAEITNALLKRCQAPEWATFFEVPNGTGASVRRYADAVAMNLFPSRGLLLHGFEFKKFRSDLLRELKDPRKSEYVQQYCDRWWLCTHKDVAKPEDIPEAWGWLELQGGKLVQKKAAPTLQAKELDRNFIASLIRRAGSVSEGIVRAERDKAYRDAHDGYEKRLSDAVESRLRPMRERMEQLEKIERAAGIKLTQWDGGEHWGHLAKVLHELGIHNVHGSVASHVRGVIGQLQNIQKTLQRYEQAMGIENANQDDQA